MGATLLPRSLASGGPAAALPQACASSSIRINPACVAKPAGAGAKKPKGPGSFDHEGPPAKRARGACGVVGPDATAATATATAAAIKKRPHPSPISDEDPPSRSPRHSVAALGVTKNQTSASPTQPPPKPPACSMRELLEKARLAKNQSSSSPPKSQACSMRKLLEEARPAASAAAADAEGIHRREIERRRAEVRRELEQMVQTVEFNDPFIDPLDVLK